MYKSLLSLDLTAKNIISGIDGKTESVQQNTEDGDTSIAILTKKRILPCIHFRRPRGVSTNFKEKVYLLK